MSRWILILCIGLLGLQLLIVGVNSGSDCINSDETRNVLKLGFDRRLNNSDGQWVTGFTAGRTDLANSTAGLKLEATHSTTECNGRREILVEIRVKEGHTDHLISSKAEKDAIVFHHRHARNVVLFNGGLSAQRINLEDLFNSGVFTNRPLKDNELFEVRIDKRTDEKTYCQGIGVMAHSPDEVKLFGSMYEGDGIWIYYGPHIYGNNKLLMSNYGANSCNPKVGDTVGVMKRDNGSLHFFMNGVDQGLAPINNVPSVVYGVYEVRGFAVKATIVSNK